jgi:hypothetical protein
MEPGEQAHGACVGALAALGCEATSPVDGADRAHDEVRTNGDRRDGEPGEQDQEAAHRYSIVITAFRPAA